MTKQVPNTNVMTSDWQYLSGILISILSFLSDLNIQSLIIGTNIETLKTISFSSILPN